MGKKDACVWLACFLLCTPMYVHAETVDDLYESYSINKTVDADEDVVSTIRSYNDMKRFVAMYNYIYLSTPDTDTQDQQAIQFEKRIQEIDTALYSGYNLPVSEILELEAEQDTCRASIDRINNTRNYSHVDIDFPDADAIPSYEEYLRAKQELSMFELDKELGDVTDVQLPVKNGSIVQHTAMETSIKIPVSSYVQCVFPGEVISADNGLVEIRTIGNVIISYSNLDYYSVNVGDKVKQYQRIATATNRLKLSMQIDGEYYDMWRLFG